MDKVKNSSVLEEGELPQEKLSDHPKHVVKDASDSSKYGNLIANPAIQAVGQLQQTLRKQSDSPNHLQRDVSSLSKGGKDCPGSSFQEGVLSPPNHERLFDDRNHIQRDTHLKRDREGTGDTSIRESIPQKRKRTRFDDSNHITTNTRETGKPIADIIHRERELPKEIRTKINFQDSNHTGRNANDSNKVGQEARDMSRTLKDWINSGEEDHSIVWPPVVVIENIITGFNKTTNKWEGYTNGEIKSYLKSINDLEYKKVMAIYRHPHGHCGRALVIFDANDLGFMNADNLSQRLQRASRGREDWCRVRPRGQLIHERDMERWKARGLVSDDGTRTIYGYLAQPSDLDWIKRHFKVSLESFIKMVLGPMKRRCQEDEKVCRDLQELEEEAEQKKRALEVEKLEINQVAAELKKKDNEVQLYRDQQEKAQKDHKMQIEKKKIEFQEAMKIKALQYELRENQLRAQLEANRREFEKEIEQCRKTEKELELGIQKEATEYERRLAETRERIAMRQIRLEKELQAKMEKKYAELEERLHKKKMELQAKQNKQLLEFTENAQKQKEEFLQEKIKEKREIEKELEMARQETERLHAAASKAPNEQAIECVKCKNKFGPKLSRALFEDCGHKDVCHKCASKLKNRKECPICRKMQAKNYVIVPYKIYC